MRSNCQEWMFMYESTMYQARLGQAPAMVGMGQGDQEEEEDGHTYAGTVRRGGAVRRATLRKMQKFQQL